MQETSLFVGILVFYEQFKFRGSVESMETYSHL